MGGRVDGDRPTHFGAVLRRLRVAAGLSQSQLADRAGMALGGVTKLEQGEREPAWRTVLDLCVAIGCEPNDFCPGPGDGGAEAASRGRPRGKAK